MSTTRNRDDLTTEERELLAYLYAKFGSRTKPLIQKSWVTGATGPLGITEHQQQTLQFLRNSRGPSWLANVKLSQL